MYLILHSLFISTVLGFSSMVVYFKGVYLSLLILRINLVLSYDSVPVMDCIEYVYRLL